MYILLYFKSWWLITQRLEFATHYPSFTACFLLSQSVVSAHWLNDGKRFMCSHTDGTLTVWSLKNSDKPAETLSPHSESVKNNDQGGLFRQLGPTVNPFLPKGFPIDKKNCLPLDRVKSISALRAYSAVKRLMGTWGF